MLYYHGAILTQNSDFGAALSVLFQSSKHSEDILNSVGFGFIFYLLYCVLHYVFTLLIQPYCDGYKKWKTTIDAAECYWLSVDSNARKKRQEDATKDSYDGWKYKNLGKSLLYKAKFDENYAHYMGQPYETDAQKAEKLVREVEEALSGSGKWDH